MHIGLIGGIGPAATDVYYRGLIARAAASGVDLELTIVHADSPTLLSNLAADDHEAQIAIYKRLTDRLVQAGAECVVVTSISGHFCIDGFRKIAPIEVLDLTEALRAHLATLGLNRVGLLGTKTVMESGMYGKLGDVETVAPNGAALNAVHEAYVELALTATATDALRETFTAAASQMIQVDGAQAILLAGTDLGLAIDGQDYGFSIVDCADVHIDAIAGRVP
ncbi:MAG: aspartate/glutamate racemase family protein [Pseudomonadota bacterium]